MFIIKEAKLRRIVRKEYMKMIIESEISPKRELRPGFYYWVRFKGGKLTIGKYDPYEEDEDEDEDDMLFWHLVGSDNIFSMSDIEVIREVK